MSGARVAFIGMTHLGLNSAVAGAERGFDIVCYDSDPNLVLRLAAGDFPIVEPNLDRLAAENDARLHFTNDIQDLADRDVIYVAPDVATDDAGRSDICEVDRLLEIAVGASADRTSIVILSQVPPGFTRERVARFRRQLLYQVETLIFGSAIERALNPERTIIGVADPTKSLPGPYVAFLRGHGDPPLLPMRFESAELAKIAINCLLAASISASNTLAELCENIGADWSEITEALRLDKRIAKHAYLQAGLGIAGGNLERDLASVLRMASAHGTDPAVVEAWLANSRHRKAWPANILQRELLDRQPDATIAFLGLAYKENTSSLKNAPSLACLAQLEGSAVRAYDPAVATDAVPGVSRAASAEACVEGVDAIVIMTPWPEFADLKPLALAMRARGRLLLDPFGCLDPTACREAGFDYFTLGRQSVRTDN